MNIKETKALIRNSRLNSINTTNQMRFNLISALKECGGLIHTDTDDNSADKIYCYVIDDLVNDRLYVDNVKAIRLNDGIIELLLGKEDVYYDIEDVMSEEAKWFDIENDNIITEFTTISIMNSLAEYIHSDNYNIVKVMSADMKCKLKKELIEKIAESGLDILEKVLGIDYIPLTCEYCDVVVSDDFLADELGVTIYLPEEFKNSNE